MSVFPLRIRLPEFQNRGIGSALVRRGLEACRQQGHRIVVVLGHPHFYQRFGFQSDLTKNLESPYTGEALMVVELVTGALNGVAGGMQYPPPFDCLGMGASGPASGPPF